MKFFDVLLGRTKPKKPDLDALFSLPSAVVSLEVATGLHSSGYGAVSFKPVAGQAFGELAAELDQLLGLSAKQAGLAPSEETDRYGYRWIVLHDPELEDLVTNVHLVNTTLEDQGFGPQLLCSLFGFASPDGARRAYLVYLYKRGTFYPFAPQPGEQRDHQLELQVKNAVAGELPIEADLQRWFPLWGVPGQ